MALGQVLPKGCYLLHHLLFVIAGLVGISGHLSPVLGLVPGFGITMSIGLFVGGAVGVYARLAADDEAEIIALRMMSLLSLAWGSAALYSAIFEDEIQPNMMGALSLIAQAAVLWGLAQGILRGYRSDVEDIQQFLVILFEDPSTDPDEGEDQ